MTTCGSLSTSVGGAFGDLGAMIEHDHALRERAHDLEIVLDDEERHAARVEPVDQLDHLRDLGRVQPGHHLVEQDQLRLQRERARDFEAAPLAQRQLAGRHLGARLQPDFGEHRGGVPHRRRRGRAWRRNAPTMTFSRVVRPISGLAIWNVRPMPRCARACGGRLLIVLVAQHDRARGRLELPADQIEQRGLAGAVRPDQAEDLAAVHRERNAVHGEQPGEAAARLFDAEESASSPPPTRRCAGEQRADDAALEEQRRDDEDRAENDEMAAGNVAAERAAQEILQRHDQDARR